MGRPVTRRPRILFIDNIAELDVGIVDHAENPSRCPRRRPRQRQQRFLSGRQNMHLLARHTGQIELISSQHRRTGHKGIESLGVNCEDLRLDKRFRAVQL